MGCSSSTISKVYGNHVPCIGTAVTHTITHPVVNTGGLPYTGLDLAVVVGIAVALIAAGVLLRVATREH